MTSNDKPAQTPNEAESGPSGPAQADPTKPPDPENAELAAPDPDQPDLDQIDLERLAASLSAAGLDLAELSAEAGDGDIDLPPMDGSEAKRLLVILPAAGSTAGAHVTAAIAWQQKFRSARAVLLAAPYLAPAEVPDDVPATAAAPSALTAAPARGPQRRYWVDPAEYPVSAESIQREAKAVAQRIEAWQARSGIDAARTILIGFSQGASIALELAFEPWTIASIVVGFAPRLYRLPVDGDAIHSAIHLIHARYDTVVPLAHAETALRRLGTIAAEVSLDIVEDGGHVVNQDHLNIATQRAMQTVFASRRERNERPLH